MAKISAGVGHFFLEGPSDARILYHAFGYPANVDFRTADEIEFDDTESQPLFGGNKKKLLELASFATKSRCFRLLCLVDADFEILVSHLTYKENLVRTEFANLPASVLTFDWLQGLLLKAYGFVLDDARWSFMCRCLQFAFIARYFSARSSRPRHAPFLSDFIGFKDNVYKIDLQQYVRNFFQLGAKDADAFIVEIESFQHWLSAPIRKTANSNDIFDIIYVMLKLEKRIRSSLPRDALKQSYLGAFDDDIVRATCFDPVFEWLASLA